MANKKRKEKRRVTRNCQSWREPRRVGPGKNSFGKTGNRSLTLIWKKTVLDLNKKVFGPGKQETGFDLEKQEVQVGPQVHLDPNWLPDIGWILVLHPIFMIYLQSHC